MLICGHVVDRLKLQSAKLQAEPSKCALQLMGCLFTAEELVNGNPSGNTNSKDELRKRTIKKLDPSRIKYIHGELCVMVTSDFQTSSDYLEEKWPNSFVSVLKKMTQKCTDYYSSRKDLRHT